MSCAETFAGEVFGGDGSHAARVEVAHGIQDFGLVVHDERSVLDNTLTDRFAAEQEDFERARPVVLSVAGGDGDGIAMAEYGQLAFHQWPALGADRSCAGEHVDHRVELGWPRSGQLGSGLQ